jgi:hypothetical protein
MSPIIPEPARPPTWLKCRVGDDTPSELPDLSYCITSLGTRWLGGSSSTGHDLGGGDFGSERANLAVSRRE